MVGIVLFDSWHAERVLTHPKLDDTRRKETMEEGIVVVNVLSGSEREKKSSYRHIVHASPLVFMTAMSI